MRICSPLFHGLCSYYRLESLQNWQSGVDHSDSALKVDWHWAGMRRACQPGWLRPDSTANALPHVVGTAYVRAPLGIKHASSRLENLEQFWGHKSSGSVVALPSPCPRSRPLQRAVDVSSEASASRLFPGVRRFICLTGLAGCIGGIASAGAHDETTVDWEDGFYAGKGLTSVKLYTGRRQIHEFCSYNTCWLLCAMLSDSEPC